MASKEQELAKKETSARISAFKQRYATKMLENVLVRKGTVLTTAAVYGTLNRMNVPNAIGGFPWKLGVGLIAQVGEGVTKGALQAGLGGIADATMAVYVANAIAADTYIAGHEAAGEEEEEGGEV